MFLEDVTDKDMVDLLNKEELEIEDLVFIAEADFTNLSHKTFLRMDEVLCGMLSRYGKRIDEYDEEYPNNPYRTGFELDGYRFWTGYTGVAGRYWGNYLAEVTKLPTEEEIKERERSIEELEAWYDSLTEEEKALQETLITEEDFNYD